MGSFDHLKPDLSPELPAPLSPKLRSGWGGLLVVALGAGALFYLAPRSDNLPTPTPTLPENIEPTELDAAVTAAFTGAHATDDAGALANLYGGLHRYLPTLTFDDRFHALLLLNRGLQLVEFDAKREMEEAYPTFRSAATNLLASIYGDTAGEFTDDDRTKLAETLIRLQAACAKVTSAKPD